MEEENLASATPENALDPIVHHLAKGNNVKYVEHWYGYMLAHDTGEPSAYIPKRFTTRHWR